MHLPDSLSRQSFLDNCWVFFAKLSQSSDGFLTCSKMIILIADILELIHFGNTLDNKQERFLTSLISSSRLFGIDFWFPIPSFSGHWPVH